MPGLNGELTFSVARALIAELGDDFPVLGVQPKLANCNLDVFRDLCATARCYVSVMRTYRPHGPYSVIGYSHGGLLAYEVACQLRELGENVLLAVIDTGPGRRGLQPQFGDRLRRLVRICANLPLWLREEACHFSVRQFAGRVARKLRRFLRLLLSGRRAPLQLDDVFGFGNRESWNYELSLASFAALHKFRPRPYAGKLTLFRAKSQPLFSGLPQDLGWQRYVQALDVREIGGDHESILSPPNIDALTRQVAELLADATWE
jgi:thioesterase domain-containing protein